MEREVITIPEIVLEWSRWVDWQDIAADRWRKENRSKEIPPKKSGVYEVKCKDTDDILYIGRSGGKDGLQQRVRQELVKGFVGKDGQPFHLAHRQITSKEDVSKVVVRWAVTDRPAAVEKALHIARPSKYVMRTW